MQARARAHTNIAMVKYWGKKDQQLMLPQTDSLSLTLDKFYSDTAVEFDQRLTHDELFINGKKQPASGLTKVKRELDYVRQLAGKDLFARVQSVNHVPIAAGLASSASAFAALAAAASSAIGLDANRQELSRIARHGSGSATRSVFGGLVKWHAGDDDQSSFAEPVMENVDFGLEMMAILVDVHRKKISSSKGMQLSVSTSPYYSAWRTTVNQDMHSMEEAIHNRDIMAIGHIAEENAMRMHALTISADPSYTYFNAGSLKAMQLVHDLRNQGVNCYYTMDAGPNVKLIYDQQDREKIINQFSPVFGKDHIVVAKPGPGVQIL